MVSGACLFLVTTNYYSIGIKIQTYKVILKLGKGIKEPPLTCPKLLFHVKQTIPPLLPSSHILLV